MACKYKYKGNWYSEEEVKKLLFISEFSKDSTIREFEKYKKSNVEIDLSDVKIEKHIVKTTDEIPVDKFTRISDEGWRADFFKKDDEWYITNEYTGDTNKANQELVVDNYNNFRNNLLKFIEKNKQYEQSKEIIEQWKKENNIQYDPEEVYSRGQGFYSSIGAYSNLELDLLLKNLIQHIEDNKKAGGEFTISAFTKPIDSRLKHIEGTGDRVRFVIYPKSEHIKWAAPTDVYSGSVWDAHEKVSKDKKSELLGVSFTKAPALRNINEVSPNLADIIDNLSHVHNELGIELTTNNFRIEYDDNIDYSTKKLIDNVNKILDDKYGKLVKPEIKKGETKKLYTVKWDNDDVGSTTFINFNSKEEADNHAKKLNTEAGISEQDLKNYGGYIVVESMLQQGKQPLKTRENTTSIESVRDKIDDGTFGIKSLTARLKYEQNKIKILQANIDTNNNVEESKKAIEKIKKEISRLEGLIKNPPQKEYTSQALTNLKVAALKEVARKYPRSLITSKVVPINPNLVNSGEIQYSKVGSDQAVEEFKKQKEDRIKELERRLFELEKNKEQSDYMLPSKIEEVSNLYKQYGFTPASEEEKLLIDSFEKKSAQEILDIIITKVQNKELKELASLYRNKFTDILNQTRLLTGNWPWGGRIEDNFRICVNSTWLLKIPTDAALKTGFDSFAKTLLHEYSHALTLAAYRNPRTSADKEFKKTIDKLFNEIRRGSQLDKEVIYGLSRPTEFIAELLSSSEFKQLAPLYKKTWIEKIIDAIKRFLNKKVLSENEITEQRREKIKKGLEYTLKSLDNITKEKRTYGISFSRTEIQNIKNEIKRLKEELERVEKEGFGALRPIYNFYENTVANILKKQGYNPTIITDEYGNTWNEVEIKQIFEEKIHLERPFKILDPKNTLEAGLKWAKEVFPNSDVKLVEGLIDDIAKGSYDNVEDVISASIQFANKGTIKHEFGHKSWVRLSEEKRKALLNEGSKLFNLSDNLAIEEKIMEMLETSPDSILPKTLLGKWFQALKQFLRDVFNNRNKIENFIKDVNEGRYANKEVVPIDPNLVNQNQEIQYSKVNAAVLVRSRTIKEINSVDFGDYQLFNFDVYDGKFEVEVNIKDGIAKISYIENKSKEKGLGKQAIKDMTNYLNDRGYTIEVDNMLTSYGFDVNKQLAEEGFYIYSGEAKQEYSNPLKQKEYKRDIFRFVSQIEKTKEFQNWFAKNESLIVSKTEQVNYYKKCVR